MLPIINQPLYIMYISITIQLIDLEIRHAADHSTLLWYYPIEVTTCSGSGPLPQSY
jgi:hypothetical protein